MILDVMISNIYAHKNLYKIYIKYIYIYFYFIFFFSFNIMDVQRFYIVGGPFSSFGGAGVRCIEALSSLRAKKKTKKKRKKKKHFCITAVADLL